MVDENIKKVRFAPSPTGPLHVGGVRTTLFNYLFAKKYGAKLVLRVEDTDKERSKREWEDQIFENLKWLQIEWDEGPITGGENGPYRQSEREEIYKEHIGSLIKEGKAYYCFCTREELEGYKQNQISLGKAPLYSEKCRDLSKEEIENNLKQNKPYVVRFKSPKEGKITFHDMIRGKIEFDCSTIGDFVIAKDERTPLYNIACVIDDYKMGITHLIRGEEHISNTPKQILLLEAFNYPRPKYAHIPLILGPDKKKLSKRLSSTSISEYRQLGYLPQALTNFIAFLGWNPGTEKEVYSMDELIKDFDIEKVQKSGAIFNIDKLDWLNGVHIRRKSLEQITNLCIPYLEEAGYLKDGMPVQWIQKAVGLYHERLKKLSEIAEFLDYIFKEEIEYPKELLKWKDMSEEDLKESIDKNYEILSKIDESDFNKEYIFQNLLKEADQMKNRGYLLWPLRVSLTGKKFSAGPADIAEVLGKERALKRLNKAKQLLK